MDLWFEVFLTVIIGGYIVLRVFRGFMGAWREAGEIKKWRPLK